MSFFKINFFASPLFIAVAGVRGQGGLDPGWEGGYPPLLGFCSRIQNFKKFCGLRPQSQEDPHLFFGGQGGGELLPKSPGYNYAAIYYSLFGNFWFIMKIK
jgi:hypothetical protein